MRVLLKVEIPVEAGNAAVVDGTLGSTIGQILEEQKPEAAYFMASNGKRAGFLFLDLKDPSQIPVIAEPWMIAFNATIECQPVMTPDDLKKAGPAIEQAAKKYGQVQLGV